jgi:hypothetical protein
VAHRDENRQPNIQLISEWDKNAIELVAKKQLPQDKWMHIVLSYDGSSKAAGVKLLVNGEAMELEVKKDTLTGSIANAAPFRLGHQGGLSARFDDLRIYRRELTAFHALTLIAMSNRSLLNITPPQRTQAQNDALRQSFVEVGFPALRQAEARLAAAKHAKSALEKELPNTMVMAELEKPRETFMRVRGAYDQLGEKVTAGVPHLLPQLAEAEGQRLTRVDLAKWLVSPQQPLTARVAVNRWWAMLFGNGIVKTINDFGAQSDWPSHPELLDWLAADFMRDWNIKRSIRQMVLSATYRQTARVSPELLARDAENRLLARGPRSRLDAEFIRDNALAVGGILNRSLGGKSIKPYQPPGIWEVNDMGNGNYVKTEGVDQYRRGLYVYWRRSTVYPGFITFDAPTREFCLAQRAKTSTPLQSLILMNDPVYVEAARAFAQRVLTEGGADNGARLDYMWRLALARAPSAAEKVILEKTLQQQLATYQQDQAAAEKLVKIGDLAKPDGIDAGELAAWTATGNVILNLNETITN